MSKSKSAKALSNSYFHLANIQFKNRQNSQDVSDDCMENFLSCVDYGALSVEWSQYLNEAGLIGNIVPTYKSLQGKLLGFDNGRFFDGICDYILFLDPIFIVLYAYYIDY